MSAALVLDCSAACSLCFGDEGNEPFDQLLAALESGLAVVPALFFGEVANVLLMAEQRQRLSRAERVEALQLQEGLGCETDPAKPAVVWHDVIHLADQCGLTSQEAAYLELAMRRGLPLTSLDQVLLAAARPLGVGLMLG